MFFNFEIPATGKKYSVDFKTYSDQYRIADSGYKVLPTSEEPLDGATVFKTADEWLAGNAALFTKAPAQEQTPAGQ